MQFSRVELENWRNFSTVQADLQTRSFIVGANASGKSNFLDAFRFLRDLVTPGGGFQDAVNRRGGVSAIRNLGARRPSNVVIEVTLSEANVVRWRYRIVFSQDNRSRPIVKEEKIWQQSVLVLNRPDEDDLRDDARLSQTYLEQTFANRDFRDITDFFKSISYSHIVPQLIRDTERSIGIQSDPYGGDFLEQIAATPLRSQEARLRRIQGALKIAIPQLSGLEWIRDEKGISHLRAKYQHWRPTGAWQTEAQFSDGTLRLIGLLWAIQVGDGPLLLEEPELSLHTGVVRHLVQMIIRIQRQMRSTPRQVFISTHSYELLSDQGIAPDEVLLLHIPESQEGTEIMLAASDSAILNELQSGFTIAEAVLPRTEPPAVNQLALFYE